MSPSSYIAPHARSTHMPSGIIVYIRRLSCWYDWHPKHLAGFEHQACVKERRDTPSIEAWARESGSRGTVSFGKTPDGYQPRVTRTVHVVHTVEQQITKFHSWLTSLRECQGSARWPWAGYPWAWNSLPTWATHQMFHRNFRRHGNYTCTFCFIFLMSIENNKSGLAKHLFFLQTMLHVFGPAAYPAPYYPCSQCIKPMSHWCT
jgi:hypothetical protein